MYFSNLVVRTAPRISTNVNHVIGVFFSSDDPGNADNMLRVDDCVVLRRVSMGGGEENPEPPTETGSRRTSNGKYTGKRGHLDCF